MVLARRETTAAGIALMVRHQDYRMGAAQIVGQG